VIRVVRVVWLAALWVVLWSDLSVANVVGGLLVAALVVGLFDSWRDRPVTVRPLAALRFVAVFSVMLVQSTVSVARTVLWPRGRITTGIVAVPLQGCSDAVVTLVADAITLTPGTLTLEARRDPLVLYVHVLDARDLDAVRRDVRRLEVLAVRAFGDAEALAGLEVDDTAAWRAS
jgi:multicomponent Na+:H+ antiporter subunit E